MTARHVRASGDRGVVIILFALVLILLMVISAFAIDVSGVYSARRSDQSAADAAALGALQDLVTPGKTDAQIAARVIELVSVAIGTDSSTFDWNSCTAADDDVIDTPVNGRNCITTTSNRDILQVRLPTRSFGGGFARIVGVDLKHSAFAIAGIEPVGLGGVLPVPVASGAGNGDGYVCVRTSAGGHLADVPPCDKNNTGDFGNADFELYKSGCPSGQPKDRWALNVARGVDHVLSLYGGGKEPWGTTAKIDSDLCGTSERFPNGANTPSTGGVTTKVVGDALFNGVGSVPGRLALNSGTELADNDRTTIGTVSVDNNGLWEFITPGIDSATSDIPESCEAHNFIPGDSELPAALTDYFSEAGSSSADRLRILLQRCITHYNGEPFNFVPGFSEQLSCGPSDNQPCTGVLFGRDSDPTEQPNLFDIQYSPRFAYVPEVHASTPLGDNPLLWAAFRPVFLQRVYGGHDGEAWSFEPEPDKSCATPCYAPNPDAVGLTVFVLPPKSLPGQLGDEDAPFNLGETIALRLVR
ncbi:MAG: TadE/TadG family type IV pilus assembly protein [Mycobacterium sp.]